MYLGCFFTPPARNLELDSCALYYYGIFIGIACMNSLAFYELCWPGFVLYTIRVECISSSDGGQFKQFPYKAWFLQMVSYVYMYKQICIHVSLYIYICIYVYAYICIYVYTYFCIYAYMYICIYV